MLGALCFGLAFGAPIVVLGLVVIATRDRAWQLHVQRSKSNTPPQRTRAWDRRQILFGSILIAIGTLLTALLAVANAWLQSISPPPPF